MGLVIRSVAASLAVVLALSLAGTARAARPISPRRPFLETEQLLAEVMEETGRRERSRQAPVREREPVRERGPVREREPVREPGPVRKREPEPPFEEPRSDPAPKKARAGLVFVKRINLIGASAFPSRVIGRVIAAYEGHRMTVREIRRVARLVEEFYHAHGYLLARAFLPEQEIVDGTIAIQVVEGRYGRVHVEGNEHYSSEFIRRFFWPARRTSVVSRDQLERALLTLNEFPDLTVQSVFKAGNDVGTSDVILKVSDRRPLHVELSFDNYGNRLVGENRATVGGLAANLLSEGDRMILRAIQAMPGDSNPFLQFEYSYPIDHYGRRVILQYSNASTIVGQELAVLDIRGDATILGFFIASPLRRTTRFSSNASVGFVGKGVENFIFGNRLQSKDELRNLVVTYDQAWLDAGGRTFANIALTQGLGEGFGGTPNGAAEASRVGGGSEFSKLTADVARVQRISPRNLVLMRAAGQVSSRPMLVPEQFSLGGADSVRGYQQSEFLGDHGYALTLEYRRTLYENGPYRILQGVLFADTGYAALDNPQRAGQPGGEREALRLTGAGAGLRAQIGAKTSLRVDVGAPLDPSPNLNGDDYVAYAQLTTRL